MSSKRRVLLTGASGTVGYEVLKQLYALRDSLDITVFDLATKKSKKLLAPFEKGIKLVFGDISNIKEVQQVCIQQDFVIHLAAIIPPLADDEPDLAEKVNLQGTKNLINSIEELSPQAFFIYSSSISVYGDRLAEPEIKVGDRLIASEGDEYAKTKIAAEKVVRESKLDWTIFRLTAIMGNHSDTKLMFHMPLSTPMEIATPQDTGRAFVHAIDRQRELSKKIYNLGGGEACRIRYAEFLSRSFAIFGLGEPDFPPKAFAEKNFHCGNYADGDDLEMILKFRKQDINDYFEMVQKSTPGFRRWVTSIFKKQIWNGMVKKSEPLQAYHTDDTNLINRFF